MKTFKQSKLYIIADFDHTLTEIYSQNCWGVLATIPNISKKYIEKSKLNNDYYFPIEQNNNIDYKIKNELMENWYQNHANLLIKYNLKEIDLNKISNSKENINNLYNEIGKLVYEAHKKGEELSKDDISNIDNSLYVSLGLMKNIKKYEEKIENLNKYIEKLKLS